MIAIIADTHGNYPALQSVLRKIDTLGIDEIISLGDVAGYYPMVNECIDEFRHRKIVNLMGNHDYYLASNTGCARSKSADYLLQLQKEIITADNLQWLSRSPLFHNQGDASMVHGGWNNPLDEYLTTLDAAYFEALPFRYFFCGHTHVQKLVNFSDKKYFCNPGSIGQPRDGDARAAFAIFDGDSISLERVDYDISATIAACKALGIPDYCTDNLSAGSRIGGAVDNIAFTDSKNVVN